MLVLHSRYCDINRTAYHTGELNIWFDRVFGDLKPQRIFTHPIETIKILKSDMKENQNGVLDMPGCIIDRPFTTLSIPLINFDISENVNTLIQNSKIENSTRAKPVIGTVRGMGGGKTRAFEEMRRELLVHEGVCLPVNSCTAFEFNNCFCLIVTICSHDSELLTCFHGPIPSFLQPTSM